MTEKTRNTELEKEIMIRTRNEELHKQKLEREKQRHEHIMEELKFMAEKKITRFERTGHDELARNKKVK